MDIKSNRFISLVFFERFFQSQCFCCCKSVIMPRTYEEELQYIERINNHCWRIKKGFVPNMNVEGVFYVNSHLEKLMFEELEISTKFGGVGGFLPGMKQIANVAALPGIVGV